MNVTGFDRFYVGTEPDTYVQEVPVPRPTPEGEQLNYMTYFDDVYTDIPKREAKWYMVRKTVCLSKALRRNFPGHGCMASRKATV